MAKKQVDQTCLPKIRDGIFEYEFHTDRVVYDARSRMIHVLNETSALIWTNCDGCTTMDDLLRKLVMRFPDATQDTLRIDVQNTIAQFWEKGLLSDG